MCWCVCECNVLSLEKDFRFSIFQLFLWGLKLHLLAARSLLIDRCRNLPVFSAIICTSKAFYTIFEMFFNWRAYCFLCWLLPFLLNWRGWECGEEQRYRNSVTYASNNDWRANDGRRSTNWPTKLVAPYLCASAVRWCWCAVRVLVALQLSPTHLPCFCLFLLLRMCKRGSSDALSKSKVTQLCHWSKHIVLYMNNTLYFG